MDIWVAIRLICRFLHLKSSRFGVFITCIKISILKYCFYDMVIISFYWSDFQHIFKEKFKIDDFFGCKIWRMIFCAYLCIRI